MAYILNHHADESPHRLLARVVEAIGEPLFGDHLMRLLAAGCGADMCLAIQLELGQVRSIIVGKIGSLQLGSTIERYTHEHWRTDPILDEARDRILRSSAAVLHAEFDDVDHVHIRRTVYPYIQDRLLLWGVSQNMEIGVSVVTTRANGSFGRAAADWLGDWSDVLLAAIAKHAAHVATQPDAGAALADHGEIERNVFAWGDMPRREAEVCARALHGVSSLGISLDLGLSEASVKTYRRRAYQRLHIGSQRELLQWYLTRWSAARQVSSIQATTAHRNTSLPYGELLRCDLNLESNISTENSMPHGHSCNRSLTQEMSAATL